jgi:putative DNA primase/helicase
MVAAVHHVDHGIVAVSRTFLAIDGSVKASLVPPRLFTGPVGGGGVWLDVGRDCGWVVVGEGIESTLSAMQLWACYRGIAALSANGIRNLKLPESARQVCIAVDNDSNGVGQDAARDAAWLWEQEGRLVRVRVPPTPDTDWNDVLLKGKYS